jgi:LPS-assembly protein
MHLPHTVSLPQKPLNASVRPVAFAVACMLAATAIWAQTAAESANQGLQLKATRQLQEKFDPEQRKGMPTYVQGDSITGRPDLETVVKGNAQLRKNGMVLRADRIEYDQPDDLAKASGSVYLQRDGNVYEGTQGQLHIDANEGYMLNPRFRLLKNNGRGEAARVDFLDEQRSVIRDGKYSVWHKEPGIEDTSEWAVKGAQVRIDGETNVGEASGARLEFKGVPIFAAPFLSFPLSDDRKSGWLPPSINIDTVSGLEVVIPYYMNLAPNRDATLYPTILTQRGINMGAEFRYLEAGYNGTARLDLMPRDSLRGKSRWGIAAAHTGTLNTGLAAVGGIAVSVALNRVSDDDYWRDFPRATTSLTQRLLANDINVNWGSGAWQLAGRALKWQTLQQTGSVITPPYDRLPQLNGKYSRFNHNHLDYSVELDTTRFLSQKTLTLQPNAQRSYALAQLSRPYVTPGTYLIPKVQLHSTRYSFDEPLATGPQAGSRSASRVVPTVSLDGGLTFERDTQFFGRSFKQTLEPRAFYTYTPFRNQTALSVYDSGANDFNFATIFSENAFTGNDRIADNNLLTLGASSRLFDPASGAEILRLNYAQRLRFSNQRVTLPGGLPDETRFSDMLFGATSNWNSSWQFDGTVQYAPSTRRSQRSTLSARYTPSPYRVISATYRLNRDVSEQVDIGWQWPINDLWGDAGKSMPAGQGQGKGRFYAVGRLNYSLRESKPVDSILGFEYDGGSWLSRFAIERLQTTTKTATKRILFQLEFVGFARAGSSPLAVLQRNVPRYQLLREKILDSSSRFSNYE